MQRDELWHIYCKKNPRFANETEDVKLSGRGLRKLFEQTWQQAHDQGVRNGRALEAQKHPRADSLFGKVFG